jgi:hypothetical protein
VVEQGTQRDRSGSAVTTRRLAAPVGRVHRRRRDAGRRVSRSAHKAARHGARSPDGAQQRRLRGRRQSDDSRALLDRRGCRTHPWRADSLKRRRSPLLLRFAPAFGHWPP